MQELRRAFQRGRRVGVWLAKNGQEARAEERRKDVRVMRQQDVALEGLGDVFRREELSARALDSLERAQARVRARREDIEARAQQDVAIEGLGDVFARAERRASIQQQTRDRINQQLRAMRAMRAGRDVPVAQEISIPTELELLRYRARDAPAIIERLRGVTGAQLYKFYREQGGSTREMIRELATLLSIKHRRAGEASIMSAQDLASTIARYVANL